MGEPERSLMDDLSEAWSAAESGEEAEAHHEVQEPENDSAHLEPEVSEDDGGDGESETPPDTEEEPLAAEADKQPEEDDDLDTAPRGFTAAAREEWKNTPTQIRKEIAKREQDFAKGIEKYRNQAQKADFIDQTIAPYRQLFAQTGTNPPQLIGQLLQTASILQGGNKQAQAQTVAALINQFGVDIEALDSQLAGQPQAQQQPQQQYNPQDVQQMAQQAAAQYYQQLEMQRTNQEVQSELQRFSSDPKNEFFNDVRNDMAVIMEGAAQNGQDMTLEEAYDRACHMNPEIRNILSQRNSAQTMQRKRTAGSSVHGTPAGSGTGQQNMSLRDTIAAQFDAGGRL